MWVVSPTGYPLLFFRMATQHLCQYLKKRNGNRSTQSIARKKENEQAKERLADNLAPNLALRLATGPGHEFVAHAAVAKKIIHDEV